MLLAKFILFTFFLITFLPICALAQDYSSIEKTVAETSTNKKESVSENVKNNQTKNLQDEFEKELARIKSFRESGTFEELIIEGDKIETQWGNLGADYYGELFLEYLGILSSSRYSNDNDVMELSREIAVRTLKKPDTFDLSLEWELLLFLGAFDYPVEKLTEIQITQRKERVELWLHAIRRLESEKDINFNPDDLPSLEVTPPLSTNLPAGVSPQAIKDTRLRADYEKAIAENSEKLKYYNKQLRILREEKFFFEEAVKYISTAYVKLPDNIEELRALMKNYRISENIQRKIETEIKRASK